jgi:Flagellar hook-length control protein FliK
MSIALKAEALGSVEVRAHVSSDQVGAAIAVERRDAHALLASDLPALHEALSGRQLRLESISLQHGLFSESGGGTAGREPSPDGALQRRLPSAEMRPRLDQDAQSLFDTAHAQEVGTIFDSNGRLSVRA